MNGKSKASKSPLSAYGNRKSNLSPSSYLAIPIGLLLRGKIMLWLCHVSSSKRLWLLLPWNHKGQPKLGRVSVGNVFVSWIFIKECQSEFITISDQRATYQVAWFDLSTLLLSTHRELNFHRVRRPWISREIKSDFSYRLLFSTLGIAAFVCIILEIASRLVVQYRIVTEQNQHR